MADPEETRPDDLVDYVEAAQLVDRSRNTVRWWVRDGHLRSWLEVEGKSNSRRMVSRQELQALVVQQGKLADPPRRPPLSEPTPGPSPAEVELRVKVAESEGLKLALEAERSRSAALEMAARAAEERAEVERMRAAEWKDRSEALTAELTELRVRSGLSWWQKLLG